MARGYRRKTQSRSRRSGRDIGREQAERHIREAEELTAELGGTDQDVKKFFFNLKGAELEKILVQYQKEHGTQAAEYARNVMPRWKDGRRRMSGMVASRLFALLPLYMKLKDKLDLVENLWKHVGPSKQILVSAGSQSNIDDILQTVRAEIEKLTTNWSIPATLEARFNWLSQNDSVTYQKLLSHLQSKEKELGLNIIEKQIPIIKAKLEESWKETTSRLSYIVDVGKQSVELRFEGDGSGIAVTEKVFSSPKVGLSDGGGSSFWWVAIIIIGLAAFAFFS